MNKLFKVAAASMLLMATSPYAYAQEIIQIEAGENIQESLQEALILAEPGSTIELPAGKFSFTGALSLDVPNITLRGAGMDKTILSFAEQKTGSEGLLITSDNVWIEGLAIEDTPGDGIKAKGVDTISFINVRVEWTGGPKAENGSYGLYPVESKNVLIDGNVVIGASDAGIYVGQSQNIIVRNSRAEYNVAGIEIENCYFADVYDNVATHNTGGILIFDMPNLPQKGGHSIRVYNNKAVNNDTANFAPPGNIVGTVPMGTGIMVMSNRDVEVFGNEMAENASVNMLIAAYPREYNDPEFNPLPRNIYVHDNTYGRGGWAPDGVAKEMIEPKTGLPIPDIVWDGAVGGVWAAFFGPDDEDAIHIKEKDGTTFANLDFVYDMIVPWNAGIDRDIEDYNGSIPPRDPIVLPQDKAGK
ncbi:right-handed parallel beta-helix repeat-containing protein [Kordiimonas sp. SCSIO 12603]|uniref:parallel beta-helix domain-containing protein n=1 Tax=Kordiimonas sp. SCSIO 12603 TaxID=2829596 RepID=UPI00210402AA|nr:parallel beta-helix domain-containing protein [Kordiimonas sp. SCSIO 12603]UTW59087.1 right-handed parallel beta-helix repeat-containing protein [Kordiimonas sp. SCSIO 12603]